MSCRHLAVGEVVAVALEERGEVAEGHGDPLVSGATLAAALVHHDPSQRVVIPALDLGL